MGHRNRRCLNRRWAERDDEQIVTRDARGPLVDLVSFVQPNKLNKPNKQEKPAGSRLTR
jgi:hypothetical protein